MITWVYLWSKTDHLWKQAQFAMFERLLSDSTTRDLVIQINLQSALEKGEKETTIYLWNALSESAKEKLITKPES
jgi:hypothetical protein